MFGPVSTNGNGETALSVAKTGTIVVGTGVAITTQGDSSVGVNVTTEGKADLTGVTVTTEGIVSHGLNIVGPGVIDLTDSRVRTTGSSAYGAKLVGEGSVLNLKNTELRSVESKGISASNGAVVTVDGGVLQAGGPASGGGALHLVNSNGSLTDVTIDTTSGGVKAESTNNSDLGTNVVLENVKIESTGNQSRGVSADGSKTIVDVSGLSFTSDGRLSDGISASNSSTVNIESSDINTEGDSAHGVSAQTGAKVTISDNTNIKVGGKSSYGVSARSGSDVTIDKSVITVTGRSGTNYGVFAINDDTRVTIKNGTSIDTTASAGAHGIHAAAGASVDVRETVVQSSGNGLNIGTGGTLIADDISVTSKLSGVMVAGGTEGPAEVTISNSRVESAGTGGSQVYGMRVTGSTGKITSNNVGLVTDGRGRNGFVAHEGGAMIMTGGSITTKSGTSTGGYVNYGTAIISGTEITTSGSESHGLSAHVDGDIDLTGVKIKTSGEDAKGLLVFERGFIHGDAQVETTGMGAHGVSAEGEGKISLENSNISTTGEYAAGIAAAPRSFQIPFDGKATIEIADSTVTSLNGASVFVGQGSDLDLKLLNTDLVANNGELFNVILGGTMNASITNANLKGAALRQEDSTSNLRMDNTSWLVTGDSDLTSLGGVNSSFIEFAAPTGDAEDAGSYLTLTVGDYSSDNSTVTFNTWLGDDNSPTDLLHVTNDTSGNTIVRVNNTGGPGKKTTGDGIMLVEVDGLSEGTFELDEDYTVHDGRKVVVSGAYAYSLHKDGVSVETGDWYLRSQRTETDPEEPLYQVGVPVYEAYPQLLLGLNSLPTLQQRVGNRYWNNAGNKVLSQGADAIEAYAPAEEAGVLIEENAIWGRIEGSHTKIKSKTSTSSTDYDYNTFKMQAGLDGLLSETDDGKLIGGVTVHYAHGKANVYSAHGDGDIKTNGYGFGGTLTWYGENGFYVDNQAQLTWYDSDLNSDSANRTLKHGNNGFGYALSVETGKRITIDENWSVTPQAQLMYSNVRFDSFTDTFGSRVSKSRADSLQGRLGISADYQNSWLNDQGTTNRSYVYGIANLYNEFLNGTKVDVSGVSFTNKRETLWAGIGLGGSYNWNDDKYSVYGEGSVNTSLKNFGDSYNYKGTVGFRFKW